MRILRRSLLALATVLPAALAGQGSPVADGLRASLARYEKNLVAAADSMPADQYGFKPTPDQLTFGEIVFHIANSNRNLCGNISGATAPAAPTLAATDAKAKLVEFLQASFAFCDSALAKVTDAGLGDSIPLFGTRKATRAYEMFVTSGDWYDHYSQLAMYLRLKGILPPTARRRM